jgi:hypothetical protein
MRKLAMLLVLMFASSQALAIANDERWYQFELIVFSHITQQALQSERWPWTPINYTPTLNTITLNADSSVGPFALLPSSYFILPSEARQLKSRANYSILLHVAWRQKIAHRRHSQPIHIFGGNLYDASGRIISTEQYGQQPYNNVDVWQVNGTVTPSLQRYIDVKFNLLFAQPLSALPGSSQMNNAHNKFAYFRLQQTRRMRSKELNYVGHPLYGVLIKVIPVDE